MTKAQKKKIQSAVDMITAAVDIINDVKADFYEKRDRNDEYYGLEDVEVNISDANENLKTYL